MTEKETNEIITIGLNTLGFGNPDSSISREKQLASGELLPEVDEVAQEFILSKEGLIDVQVADDGCIDGRHATAVTMLRENGERYTSVVELTDHERAKVAGGGYITTSAMWLGVGERGENPESDFLKIGATLAENGIFCGGHTGPHIHVDAEGNETNTDCGANDKMPLILENALTLMGEDENGEEKPLIIDATKALIETAGLVFNKDTFNGVLSNWADALNDEGYFPGSDGRKRLSAMIASQDENKKVYGEGKAIDGTKDLEGDHNEDYILVNYIQGKTFSQGKMLQHLQEKFPNLSDKQLAQAFVVDAWRVVELAQASVSTDDFEAAVYAGVMYQVATAATLTDGTLQMFAYTEEK